MAEQLNTRLILLSVMPNVGQGNVNATYKNNIYKNIRLVPIKPCGKFSQKVEAVIAANGGTTPY